MYPGIGDRGVDKYVMLVVDADPLDRVGAGGARGAPLASRI